MRLESDSGDFLEIQRADGPLDAYDLLLVVCTRFHGFAAETEAWVKRPAWMGFTQDLIVLEQRRQGEAKLDSVSPEELAIVIRSIDRAGHMGCEGMLGVRGYGYNASLQFSVLVFDPSQLPAFVYGAREIGSRMDGQS
jgi:hypothetical protein